MAKANSCGLIGQSWWEPLDNWEYCERLSFVITESVGELYKTLIHEMKLGPYLDFCGSHPRNKESLNISREIGNNLLENILKNSMG